MNKKKHIRESGKSVAEQVTQNIYKILEDRFFVLEEKFEQLKETVENQEKKIYFLEKQARQRNIIFFGIEELESSYDTLEKNMIQWLEQYFSINISYNDLQEVKRIGKKGDKPRPLLVSFSNLGIKIKIFKQKRALRDTSYYMKEDYPKHVLEKRKQLQDQLKTEREKGNTAFLKYDKLVILKQTYKRKLSPSPIASIEDKPMGKKQINKKNKPQQHDPPARRSNSISEEVTKPRMLNLLINRNSALSQEVSKNTALELAYPLRTDSTHKYLDTRNSINPPTRLVTVEDYDHNPPKKTTCQKNSKDKDKWKNREEAFTLT